MPTHYVHYHAKGMRAHTYMVHKAATKHVNTHELFCSEDNKLHFTEAKKKKKENNISRRALKSDESFSENKNQKTDLERARCDKQKEWDRTTGAGGEERVKMTHSERFLINHFRDNDSTDEATRTLLLKIRCFPPLHSSLYFLSPPLHSPEKTSFSSQLLFLSPSTLF